MGVNTMGKEMVRCAENIVEPDGPTREELLALVAAQHRDWMRLNVFLNTTAMHYHWCGEYEHRLEHYNRSFESLKLVGRSVNQVAVLGVPDPFAYTAEIADNVTLTARPVVERTPPDRRLVAVLDELNTVVRLWLTDEGPPDAQN